MSLKQTSVVEAGWTARDFDLRGVDGKRYRLADVRGRNGTLVMFICNHCPYVLALLDDIVRDVAELAPLGIGAIAMMPNDTDAYPQDSFERMQLLSAERKFGFPYVIDETQDVARAYGAVCTPDFFGFGADLGLRYRGRLTEVRHLEPVPDARRELFEAMRMIAECGEGPAVQHPSMGCSIKWRD
ncbi:thioredoxin family protein [Oceanibacterium hippocampi]|uniref:AhpC/TSA family protein n=1 Tax=Oceanibacterium hippocampi TaxID=745714 RepID=A0A1Y5SY38_9PROT|nr:thioredoxin family protein [Oceanibacterium hippocampi]SLN47787.1 AhpC/TSA family protein [Oceanibacterium hippocampi]